MFLLVVMLVVVSPDRCFSHLGEPSHTLFHGRERERNHDPIGEWGEERRGGAFFFVFGSRSEGGP
jgi:hypothetical protein